MESLFTGVRGIRILRISYPRSCIAAPHALEFASQDTPHSPGPLGLVTPVDRYAGLWMRQSRKLMFVVLCVPYLVCV
jgi:hypothetical protein